MGTVEKYGHGGDLLTASELFGRTLSDWTDFSANINPLGPPARLLKKLAEEMDGIIRHYPDSTHRRLRDKLSSRLGVAPDRIAIGNGAAECIALLLLWLAPKRVGLIYPCFSEYGELAGKFGAETEGVFGKTELYGKPVLSEVGALMERTDVVFIGHPNNPTGTIYTLAELRQLAEWTKEKRAWLAVDEAFLDFLPVYRQASLLSELDRYQKVLLIRSMTKMFAIPGLRLGYAIASREAIRGMTGKQVSWSVNGLALLAGELCLDEEDYEERTRELVARERNRMAAALHSLGYEVWPGEANYLLVRMPEGGTAEKLQERLGRKGILIRSCSAYPGLTERDFRIAIRSEEENHRLLDALSALENND